MLAGAEYRDFGLVEGLRAAGANVVNPVEGLGIGEQIAWLQRSAAPIGEKAAAPAPNRTDSTLRSAGARRLANTSASQATEPPRAGTTYRPLYDLLVARSGSPLTLSFVEISRLLGRALPASASRHRPWWGNHVGTHSHARAWLAAGWEVDHVSLGESVTFRQRENGA